MRITLTFVAAIIVIGCRGQLNINDYFDSSQPIELTVDSIKAIKSNTVIVTQEDERIKKLINWGSQNLDKWKSTPATYAMADVYVTQSNFHFRYWKSGFVVVEFRDKDGKPRQMTKKLNDGELSFLWTR